MEYFATNPKDIERFLYNHSYGDSFILNFEHGEYVLNDFKIPFGCPYVEIRGNGSRIKFNKTGFTCLPPNQKSALDIGTNSRFIIKDFNIIEGGNCGINLGSSFNSQIQNINFINQKLSSIRLRFCLMTSIKNILVTNPEFNGIEILEGNWFGSNFRNSQSNHTILEQCRVYSKGGEGSSYLIRNSSGVKLKDCIAEGHPNRYAVYYSAKGNSVVKHFKIENFHLEYAPDQCGIYISADASTSNIIDSLYVSSNDIKYPVFIYRNSPVQIKNIGWWDSRWKIYSTHTAPRILIDQCHYRLNYKSVYSEDNIIYKNYIRVINSLIA